MGKRTSYHRLYESGKMNIFKRITAIVLTVIMVVTLAPESLLHTYGVNSEVKAETTLSNPRIEEDSSLYAGQKVTWDCVWFGSYPQTEIVDQASTSGCYGRSWSKASDYEVNTSLYTALQNASYNANGDTTIGNTKYRRIMKSDATYGTSGSANYYNWSDSTSYHYFRYEPIKWRVLNVNDGQALLLADKVLDDQQYNTSYISVTWENSTIRSWLNGYGSSSNTMAQIIAVKILSTVHSALVNKMSFSLQQ